MLLCAASGVSAPAQATCTTVGSNVTCAGAANPLAPSYANGANNLNVTVNNGATLGVLLGSGGNVMTLTGVNNTLTNNGQIDVAALGTGLGVLSSAVVLGNAAGSTQTVVNIGLIRGSSGVAMALTGMAIAVQNGAGGTTNITNSGLISTIGITGATLTGADAGVLVTYGGGQANIDNSGTITGRVALGSAAGGNTFTNSGTVNGSVSLGQNSTNQFIATTGSSVSAAGGTALQTNLGIGTYTVSFAATGIVDGGAGGDNTLTLQQGSAADGWIDNTAYINFNHLDVQSGKWTLSGASGASDATLGNGATAILDNAASLGTGQITSNGGTLQLATTTSALTLSNVIELTGNGLTISDANALTLSGTIIGDGQLSKASSGTLTLSGANSYTGGTVLSAGTLLVGSNAALGTGRLFVDGAATLDSTRIVTIANAVSIFGGNVLSLAGSNAMTLVGAIGGTGSVIKNGASTVTLSAANTYTGGTVINAGTLKLGAGGSLAATGAVTLAAAGAALDISDSGANQTIGAFSGAAGTTVALGASNLIFGDAANTSFSGVISGAGGIDKQGAGIFTLSGVNTYTGGTTVSGGTLILGPGAALAPTGSLRLANAGAVFDISTSGADLTIGALSGVTGTLLSLGPHTLTFGDGSDQVFGGVFAGTGDLVKQGSGATTLSGDNSAFSGNTRVTAGTLLVDGTLGGSLNVQSGAALGGTGAVGSTVIASGGMLAPGNAAMPKGTLTINGNLTFEPGSSYQVRTDATGASSSVHATGTAALAGAVLGLADEGLYNTTTHYSILRADGGITGTFDDVRSSLAFLTPTLGYEANSVDLVMTMKQVPTVPDDGASPPARDIRFADLAQSDNQRATANALQSLPTSSNLYLRVLNLPEGAPAGVFNSLSGEAHASAVQSLQSVGTRVSAMSLSHLQANLAAGLVAGPPSAQLGRGDASMLPRSAAQPVWAQVFGTWGSQSGSDGVADTRSSDGGVFVGGDQAIGGGWRLGGALGYTGGHTTARGVASTTDVDSYTASIYGGKAYDAGAGKINLSLGAAYTWHDVKTRRQVDAAGDPQTLRASYGANTSQVFGELGYAMPLADRYTLEPFLGAGYSDLRTRGFSESGGDAALDGNAGRNRLASTTLGLHARMDFESAGAPGRVHMTLGWRHAYGDLDPEATLAFQDSQTFTVTGTPIARDAAVIELGVDAALTRNTTVALNYGGQFGSSTRQNAGSLTVRYRF